MKVEYVEAIEGLVDSGRCTQSEIDQFSGNELVMLARSVIEYVDSGESLTIKQIEASDYEFDVPDLYTLIDSPYWLGTELGRPKDETGQPIVGEKRQIYDFWIDKLEEIYIRNPGKNHQILVTGAIGIGKTTFMNIVTIIDMINVMALKNPQAHFGLMPSTKIVFAFFSILQSLALDVGYTQFHEMMNSSPFFNDQMIFNKKLKEGYQLTPPKGLKFRVGSRVSHTLGQAVLDVQLDEANFGQDVQDKKADDKKSQVYDNYISLLRRKESRFLDLPGHFLVGSSKKGTSDFLEKHIETSKGQEGVMVIDSPQYIVKKCRGIYSGVNFKILLGDETNDPKILVKGERVPDNQKHLIEVIPVEHRSAYEYNIVEAIRDISGKASQPMYAFIDNRKIIRELIDEKRKNPWKYNCRGKVIPNTIHLGFYGDDQIKDFLIEENILYDEDKQLPYKHNPRFLAIDTGYVGDACGISMCCKAGIKLVKQKDEQSDKMKAYWFPKYYSDFYIRVKGKGNDQFPLYKLTEFVKYLMNDLRINIKGMSTDGFQSVQLRQDIKIAFPNMDVELLSVDKEDTHHINMKNILYSKALDGFYHDKNMLVELFDLQHINVPHRGM